MPVHVRMDGQVAVLSNFGHLFNDPRYVDAAHDVRKLLDEGIRHFVVDLTSLRDLSDTALGLLMTLTRLIHQAEGEVVLAHVARDVGTYLEAMRMDDYWDLFPTVAAAVQSFGE